MEGVFPNGIIGPDDVQGLTEGTRVRIGPIHDLAQLNKLRAKLQQSDLDALVIRVDD